MPPFNASYMRSLGAVELAKHHQKLLVSCARRSVQGGYRFLLHWLNGRALQRYAGYVRKQDAAKGGPR